MKYFFSLRISANEKQVENITYILGIKPNYPEVAWGYELKIKDNAYTNFIDFFLSILNDKYEQLQNIGISKDHISIWMIYEYDGQCNMEFSASDMKKLGNSGITFCISCYESDNG